jgi:hypothetical protein
MEIEIRNAAAAGIKWLKKQNPVEVKDLCRSIQALTLWDEESFYLVEILLSKKKEAYWETDRPVIDTSRAFCALAGAGILQLDSIKWIRENQVNDNWNNNEIETSYALIALGDAGIRNEPGCEWLFHNYGKKWEHAGTTSLILMAWIKQDSNTYKDFIKGRAGWLLSKRIEKDWVATGNLVLQALILSEEISRIELSPSIQWLLGKQNNDNWGDITSTALSLISLRLFLN